MQLSLLSLVNAAPTTGIAKELENGQQADAQTAEGFSFEELLQDLSLAGLEESVVIPNGIDAVLAAELVPNLVITQATSNVSTVLTSAAPADILAALTGNQRSDAKLLASIEVNSVQSSALVTLVEKFLARPDASAELTDAQRSSLLAVVAQLKNVVAGEVTKPLAPVIAPLLKMQNDKQPLSKDGVAIISQVMKWIQQVLRDAAAKSAVPLLPAQGAVSTPNVPLFDDASLEEVALLPFQPDGTAQITDAKTEKEGGEIIDAQISDLQLAVNGISKLTDGQISDEQSSEDGVSNQVDTQAIAFIAAPIILRNVDTFITKAIPRVATGDVRSVSENAAAVGHIDAAQLTALQVADKDPVLDGEFSELMERLQKVSAQFQQVASVKTGISQEPIVTDDTISMRLIAESSTQGVIVQNTVAVQQVNAAAQYSQITPRMTMSEQVHVAIKKADKEGTEVITIQLTPEDLGRVDVRMEKMSDGRSHITFTIDKAETFDQLQRDARMLEKALQDAGVKADAGSMEFNLRQQHQGQDARGDGHDNSGNGNAQWNGLEAEAVGVKRLGADAQDEGVLTQNYTVSVDTGVNIRV